MNAQYTNRLVELKTPGAILFGQNAHQKLAERIANFNCTNVLIVTDKGLAKAGTVDKIKDILTASEVQVAVFDGVDPDPDRKNVQDCLEIAKTTNAELLIGLGGGSSMDVAKVTAALSINKGDISEYVGIGKLPKKGLPTILMPTTSGTGSEVSPIAIISDKKQHLKLGIVSDFLYCDLAIVDPLLTLSCPASVTASSGMDALTHAIEIFTNKFAVPMIDTLMLEAISLTAKHLLKCVTDPSDIIAREGMSLASLYAGMGLGPVNTAAVHALAYPLGGTYNIAHGLANSILLPYVMEFNRPKSEEKFAQIADAFAITNCDTIAEKATAAVKAITKLSRDVGIPEHLKQVGIPEEAIPEMATSAATVTRLLNNNPREMTVKDIENIYRQAY